MEFKADPPPSGGVGFPVDIGTEWNLKVSLVAVTATPAFVDIGTEWNLKEDFRRSLK